MNREETGRVLDLIRAHYWQTLKAGENDRAMMLETWTLALSDVPLTPYTEIALEWWFKYEKWPPQAADIRERARAAMDAERTARELREMAEQRERAMATHGRCQIPALGAALATLEPWERRIRNELTRRAANKEIAWSDIDAEFERRRERELGATI